MRPGQGQTRSTLGNMRADRLGLLPPAPQGAGHRVQAARRAARVLVCGGVPGGGAQPLEVAGDPGGGDGMIQV